MLLTTFESVGKSIEGAGKSLAIHCLVVIAKYWCLPVQEESVNLPFSREELYINWRGVWNKALSDLMQCQILLVIHNWIQWNLEGELVIYQKSLKAFLQAPLQFAGRQIKEYK